MHDGERQADVARSIKAALLVACTLGCQTEAAGVGPVDTVAVSPAVARISPSASIQLVATALDALDHPLSGHTFSWSTSAPGTATVDASGLVTAIADGTVTITASTDGHSGMSEVTVGPWPNEPSGLSLISDNPWNCTICNGWGFNDTQTIQTDITAPHSPANVLRVAFPPAMPPNTGPGTIWYSLNNRELYVGYYIKLSSNWEALNQGGKLHMNWTESNLTFGLLREGRAPHSVSVVVLWPPYGYDWPGANPDGSFPNNVATTPIQLDTWYLLEFYYKFSTGSGSDGIIRWWVNGVLQGNYTNIHYPSGENFIEFQYAFTRQDSPLQTEYVYIDHTRLSGR